MKQEGGIRGALLTKDQRRILSWGPHELRLWDVSLPRGNLLEIGCALLAERDLTDISKRYGIHLTDPICEPGKTPVAPD